MKKRVRFFENVYYSFPVQLLFNHVKKNQVLLLIWALLFGFITQNLASIMGVPYLFLDPEYLNETNYKGFFIIGVALGIFISAFHITTYILDSYRFTFLGTIRHPFANFCLNNSIIPIAFTITYVFSIIQFQKKNGQQVTGEISSEILALLCGLGLTILLNFLYFRYTNKDIFKELARNLDSSLKRNTVSRVNVLKKIKSAKKNKYYVSNYIDLPFKLRTVPEYNEYDKNLLSKIFDQNHLNAVIVEIFVIILIITLGLFRDITYFQIPAAASGILFFSIIIMFTGAFSYWLRGWAITLFLIVLVSVNLLFKKDIIQYSYQVFGINYNQKPARYDLEKLHELSNRTSSMSDIKEGKQLLDNWKNKFGKDKKPKIVFICTSGGGQRAATWTIRTLQVVDSAIGGNLMPHTALITGASGGLIGAAYYREMFYRHTLGEKIQLYDKKYFDNIAKDVLNPIIFSMVVNDFFFRFQKFTDGKYEYLKDRGYEFERQININTDFFLNRRLNEYYLPEKNGKIPVLLISPTIINDGRKLFISPQPMSYMTFASQYENRKFMHKIKGIEFSRFFKDHDASNLHFMSALRMSATFPYITPNVDLPSVPKMEIMDAGLSDNFGISNAIRYLTNFKDWIEENTSGVIFVIIRDSEKDESIRKREESSLFQKILTPIGSLYSNWDYFQDFNNENLVELSQSGYKGNFDVVEFQYIPRYDYWNKNQQQYSELSNFDKNRAALSWHLTKREKESLFNTIYESNNRAALIKLQNLMKD